MLTRKKDVFDIFPNPITKGSLQILRKAYFSKPKGSTPLQNILVKYSLIFTLLILILYMVQVIRNLWQPHYTLFQSEQWPDSIRDPVHLPVCSNQLHIRRLTLPVVVQRESKLYLIALKDFWQNSTPFFGVAAFCTTKNCEF